MCPHVFLQTAACTPPFILQADEIAACRWVPLTALSPANGEQLVYRNHRISRRTSEPLRC